MHQNVAVSCITANSVLKYWSLDWLTKCFLLAVARCLSTNELLLVTFRPTCRWAPDRTRARTVCWSRHQGNVCPVHWAPDQVHDLFKSTIKLQLIMFKIVVKDSALKWSSAVKKNISSQSIKMKATRLTGLRMSRRRRWDTERRSSQNSRSDSDSLSLSFVRTLHHC